MTTPRNEFGRRIMALAVSLRTAQEQAAYAKQPQLSYKGWIRELEVACGFPEGSLLAICFDRCPYTPIWEAKRIYELLSRLDSSITEAFSMEEVMGQLPDDSHLQAAQRWLEGHLASSVYDEAGGNATLEALVRCYPEVLTSSDVTLIGRGLWPRNWKGTEMQKVVGKQATVIESNSAKLLQIISDKHGLTTNTELLRFLRLHGVLISSATNMTRWQKGINLRKDALRRLRILASNTTNSQALHDLHDAAWQAWEQTLQSVRSRYQNYSNTEVLRLVSAAGVDLAPSVLQEIFYLRYEPRAELKVFFQQVASGEIDLALPTQPMTPEAPVAVESLKVVKEEEPSQLPRVAALIESDESILSFSAYPAKHPREKPRAVRFPASPEIRQAWQDSGYLVMRQLPNLRYQSPDPNMDWMIRETIAYLELEQQNGQISLAQLLYSEEARDKVRDEIMPLIGDKVWDIVMQEIAHLLDFAYTWMADSQAAVEFEHYMANRQIAD